MTNHLYIKDFLGKYFQELYLSSQQQKYLGSGLSDFFDQRFIIQDNKVQMIIDPKMKGLSIQVHGNEIFVSQELFDHPMIEVSNSIESDAQSIPASLYSSESFSLIAFLICQNHTMFRIIGALNQPIYVKYTSEFEHFYNSVIIFDILNRLNVEIVEEIESHGALNTASNYIIHDNATLRLTTIYSNTLSSVSMIHRHVISQSNSTYVHNLLGTGSSLIIDENKLVPHTGAKVELNGIINSKKSHFHSVVKLQPTDNHFTSVTEYRNILQKPTSVTFYPMITGDFPEENAKILISNIDLDEIPEAQQKSEIITYIKEAMTKFIAYSQVNVERFDRNRDYFLQTLL